jgi:hypothetical protein
MCRVLAGDPRRAELSADFEALGVGRIEMLIGEDQVYMRGGVFDDLLSQLPGNREWLFVDLTAPAVLPLGGFGPGPGGRE